MATYLPPNVWVDAPCTTPEPPAPATDARPSAEPPAVSIDTVGDYIAAHGLHVIIAVPNLHDLPIGTVKVEHDEETQLTYFSQHGNPVGTASWSPRDEAGPEAYSRRGR